MYAAIRSRKYSVNLVERRRLVVENVENIEALLFRVRSDRAPSKRNKTKLILESMFCHQNYKVCSIQFFHVTEHGSRACTKQSSKVQRQVD